MADTAVEDSVAIICGGGGFPGAVADAVVRRGHRPVMFALKGWADAKVIEPYTHYWIAIGQVGRFLRLARAEHCTSVMFIGTLLRPSLSQIRLDWQTICSMPRIIQSFRGGDDRLLSGVASIIEANGLRVIGVGELASEILVPEGVLGRYQPSERDKRDIARGLALIAAIGPFDVGQAAVVADNHVVAVEAAEGTDNLIARVAELRRTGRVATPRGVGVLVKAPKPAQDRRFDLPSIGPRTIENAARAGLAGVAVAANTTMMIDAAEVAAIADREKMFFAGVTRECGP
ncbi:MAG TPA: UDP-2,3-diacylglucosamine diphosphatase LpxI [Xanthobacteraceae bacterium]|nr:UDP-2,3-diacylglucosamine diphosphatase LpxI [Xanthobacteraceae bacterium]